MDESSDGLPAPETGTPGAPSEPRLQIESGWRGVLWQIVFPVVVVLVALLVPTAAWVGKEAILDTRGRAAESLVVDPAAPGYEAVVEPTPTMLLVQVDDAGVLVGLTLLAKPGDATGAVLFVPVNAVVDADRVDVVLGGDTAPTTAPAASDGSSGATTAPDDAASPDATGDEPSPAVAADGPMPLRDVYAAGGTAAVVRGVESLLGFGIGDPTVQIEGEAVDAVDSSVAEVDAARWAELVEPMAPLTVSNLDAVVVDDADGQPVEVFASGDIELAADQVGEFLAVPAENELDRIRRHQSLWLSWLDAIGASGDVGAIPGESEVGLGAFLRDLTTRTVRFWTVPVEVVRVPGTVEDLFLVDRPAFEEMRPDIVPFPVGSVASPRPVLKVLDGTGDPAAGLVAAELLIAAGGEVHITGNAAAFDHVENELVYYDESLRAEAERLAEVIGGARLTLSDDVQEVVNFSFIIGTDFTDGRDLQTAATAVTETEPTTDE